MSHNIFNAQWVCVVPTLNYSRYTNILARSIELNERRKQI